MQDVSRFAQKSKAEKLLEGCERQLLEVIIRYGGLPIVLQPEQVEQKFGNASATPQEKKEEETDEAQKHKKPLIEADDSPLVAPYVYASLKDDDLEFSQPLYQQVLIECANMADEAYERRRAAIAQGVKHEDAPPFFDAPGYFTMHANMAIVQEAEALTDDRYMLSTTQAKMYTPDERRLIEIVPRLINDFKHATIGIERERILQQIRMPEILGNEKELVQLMSRLQEINAIESLFAKELGGRIINK